MSRDVDVAGLVDHFDKVNYDHIHLVFEYLTELSEYGNYDKVIAYGAIPRAVEMMSTGPPNQRKAAMFLLYSLISHGRGDIVLTADGVIESAMSLLVEEQEEEVQRGVAYIMSMLCSLGGAETFIENDGIEKIAPLIRSDDENTVLYTLHTLTTISAMGYQEEILETKVNQHISYHMPNNKDIEKLRQMLLADLYHWDEESFTLDEKDLEIIDKRLEMIGIEGGYLRPQMMKHRIEPRDGIILGQNGKELPRNEEKEMIIEIKRKKLAIRKRLKEKQFEDILNGLKKTKKIKEEPQKEIKQGIVKQRVLKRDFEDEMFMKRKIDNVISGKLDPPPVPITKEDLEPKVPPELEDEPDPNSTDPAK
jgi:hypothetical protein